MNLREEVESQLPKWRSWYPSLFEAARDLGIIVAEVCPPSQLLLSNRHARVRQDAANAHREKWGGTAEDVSTRSLPQKNLKGKKRRR